MKFARGTRRRIGLTAAATAGLILVATLPALATPDPLYPVKQFGDLIQGSQQVQSIAGADQTQPFGANPYFMPDWNHDGTFGDSGDVAIENSTNPATAPFRYPCIGLNGTVTYRTTTGTCAPGDTKGVTFVTGDAIKVEVVDSLGWRLAGTIFLPAGTSQPGAPKRPGVVIADGAQAAMQTFYMYSMTLVQQGIIVMNFDFAGQGQSEDSGGFSHDFMGSGVGGQCHEPRPCLETEDMVRWFTGLPITSQPASTASEFPFRGTHDPAGNPTNPVRDALDTARVGLIGQSMGGLTVSNFLWFLPTGRGADGRPIPTIHAAIGLSGFAPAHSVVPYQLQTADLDIPGRDQSNFIALTDGPVGTKAYYDDLRAHPGNTGALELIVMESGSHGDTSNSTRFSGVGTPHAVWSWQISTFYAANWMSCYLAGTGCAAVVSRQPHLSRAQASEYDLDGAGPQPSRCITVPDRATLEQLYYPDRFVKGELGAPAYDCKTG